MVLTLFGNINISSAQTKPDFKGIFLQTVLEKQKPCTHDGIWCTGLFYAKMHKIEKLTPIQNGRDSSPSYTQQRSQTQTAIEK